VAVLPSSISAAHVWDASTVAALDAIVHKFAAKGKQAEIVGLNEASTAMHRRLSGHLGAGH
jgi:SulP family sulfate permease